MSTIKEIATACGVSEQAIRGWCRRNHVAKDERNAYVIDESTESSIYRHYKLNNVAKPKGNKGNVSERGNDAVLEVLKGQLEQKDKQINDLTEQLTKTTVALMAAQESVKAAQALQANAEKKLIEQEQKPEPEEPEPPKKKKHWWWR